MVPFKLDYVIDQTIKTAGRAERRLLKELAGVTLTTAEAQAEWPRLLEHKWFVSERLGRDIGLRAAAIDYFENVRLPRAVRPAHTSRLRAAAEVFSVTA